MIAIPPAPLPPVVNYKEAARLLGISVSGLRNLCKRGEITKIPIGERRVVFLRSDLFAYIEKRMKEKEAPNGGTL
jgi:excisionase family DNA binding protein